MTPTAERVLTRLADDFDRARMQLLEARRDQARKDGPLTRAAVAECRAEIDAILDRYLRLPVGRVPRA
jgi:hypothetical protein